MLTFDEQEHIYRWDGRVTPSVTQVLREWHLIEHLGVYVNVYTGVTVGRKVLEAAGEEGNAIHRACSYLAQGIDLDWDALHPDLVAPCNEFLRWKDDFKVRVIHSERRVYSKKHDFAGTMDLGCFILGNERVFCLPDIKTGESAIAGPQTAGYEIALREEDNLQLPVERYKLYIPRDGGKYQFTKLNKPHNVDDAAFFLSTRFRYQYMERMKAA